MSGLALALVVAAMFFMVYLEDGRTRQTLIRCVMCGSRHDEQHHRDCPWGKE